MYINTYYETINDLANEALFMANALERCACHSDIVIRPHNYEAERHAYALANIKIKQNDTAYMRSDLTKAIHDNILEAVDDECPVCAAIMRD
ncbi:hypothetical protein GCM10011497_02040 [Elstera cyanobacteriorum]|uniref:Uncharacterized protein n=1 Tax=Elstera cyanobacteriorum TaxID=2022747 RepID=A0A255XQR7_9PROT|nr:hypothetical protein CHR90_11050 [Elstera cyanobacteriorum]GFZ77709.1 hypothetical protein GCM10011497_02040 [Elstera cyanobacteriorum]